MIRRLRPAILLAALAPTASCAAAPSEADAAAGACALTVSFGSYAMGIDRGALADSTGRCNTLHPPGRVIVCCIDPLNPPSDSCTWLRQAPHDQAFAMRTILRRAGRLAGWFQDPARRTAIVETLAANCPPWRGADD